MELVSLVTLAGDALEGAGVAVVVAGTAIAILVALFQFARRRSYKDSYRKLREGVGRAILLGLELLVGADIIRTVGETPTLRSVAVLGMVVLIRTFLSFTLEVELEGRWP